MNSLYIVLERRQSPFLKFPSSRNFGFGKKQLCLGLQEETLCVWMRTKVDLSFKQPTPSEFMSRVSRLEALAHPKTEIESRQYAEWMNAAKANGLNYVEALEYVIGMKSGGAH